MKKNLSIIVLVEDQKPALLHKTIRSLSKDNYDVYLNYNLTSHAHRAYLDDYKRIFERHNIPLNKNNNIEDVLKTVKTKFVLFINAGDIITKISLRNIEKKIAELKTSDDCFYPQATVDFYTKHFNPEACFAIINPDRVANKPYMVFEVESQNLPLILPVSLALSIQYSSEHILYNIWINTIIENRVIKSIPNTVSYRYNFDVYDAPKQPIMDNRLVDKLLKKISSESKNTRLMDTQDFDNKKTRKESIKASLEAYPLVVKAAQKSLHIISLSKKKLSVITRILEASRHTTIDNIGDAWIIEDSSEANSIDVNIFISNKSRKIVAHKEDGKELANVALTKALQELDGKKYDYVLMVPWLIAGGADLFFVNYANKIARLRPNKKVLVVSTEPSRKSLTNKQLKLNETVDFLRLSDLIPDDENYTRNIALSLRHIINIFKPAAIHSALSKDGYRYLIDNANQLRKTDTKIVLTGYNQVINKMGYREGYIHDEIIKLYPHAHIITTDNQRLPDLWEEEYGLNTDKVKVHHQPFDIPAEVKRNNKPDEVRILWASHIRIEKNPETLVEVAKKLSNKNNFIFDCYGENDKSHYPTNPFVGAGIRNINYKGPFKQFFKDINLSLYDVFVYTSMYDGTPNIVIEAGLAKLPIITSAIGGIPELVENNATLIKNPKDSDAFAQALLDYANNPNRFKEKSERLYKKLTLTQTHDFFESEVDSMLKEIGY